MKKIFGAVSLSVLGTVWSAHPLLATKARRPLNESGPKMHYMKLVAGVQFVQERARALRKLVAT